jgi:hypothetical protein
MPQKNDKNGEKLKKMDENKQEEEAIIQEVSKVGEKDQIVKKSKKVWLIAVLITVFLASLSVAAYVYWKKIETPKEPAQIQTNLSPVATDEKGQDKTAKLVLGENVFEDRSLQDPIDANIDLGTEDSLSPRDELKLFYIAATKGVSFNQASQCEKMALNSSENYFAKDRLDMNFCIGGMAAYQDNQNLCETYDFKAKYNLYSMCDGGCAEKRNFMDGNSAFESCYIGYGIIKKDEQNCLALPDVIETKNFPEFSDDKTSPREMKQESCIYGAAIGKNNYDLCEYAGFFKDSCYYHFAVYRKSAEICDMISNTNTKYKCISSLSHLANVIDKCMQIEKIESSGPVSYSNIPKPESERVNKETEDRDSCVFNVVDSQKLTDRSICEKIISPYYKYLCRQRIAMNLKDFSLCNLDFLGSQGNVDGCIYDLSKELKDISLCQKASDYDRCVKMYNGEDVPTIFSP